MAEATDNLSYQRGKWGEKVAHDFLVANGYAITATNWHMGHYEIDIVARKDQYIIFVEVKTRARAEDCPVEAVNKRKRARMIASADVFLRHYNIPFEYRFDIIAVTGVEGGEVTVEHIPDAFMPPLKKFNYSFRL